MNLYIVPYSSAKGNEYPESHFLHSNYCMTLQGIAEAVKCGSFPLPKKVRPICGTN